MKRLVVYLALCSFTLFLAQDVAAQQNHNNRLFKLPQKQSRSTDQNLPKQFTLKLLDSLKTSNEFRLLTPNSPLAIKNKGQNNSFTWAMPDSLPVLGLYKFDKHAQDLPVLFFEAQQDPNAGSIDPGIFYNPDESTEPAGIIIKPLQNLDPKMVINPDGLRKKQ